MSSGDELGHVTELADEWLAAAPYDVAGLCGHAAEVLQRAFPSLKWGVGQHGSQPHNWVELSDGTIVDPTRSQFGYRRVYVIGPDDPDRDWYTPADPDDLVVLPGHPPTLPPGWLEQ